jgi:hypothetical protein
MNAPSQTPLTAYQVDKNIRTLLYMGYRWERGPSEINLDYEMTHHDLPGVIISPNTSGLHGILVSIYEQARALPAMVEEGTHDVEEGEPCDILARTLPDEITDGEPLEAFRHDDCNGVIITT